MLNRTVASVGLLVLGAWVSACAGDNLPDAPVACGAPFTTLTPWWDVNTNPGNGCSNGTSVTSAPIQARDGVVFYGAADSLCAVDQTGIRTLASTPPGNRPVGGDVGGIWLDSDRVVFTDGIAGVYAAPIGGGDTVVLFPFADNDPVHGYDYDGTFFYWVSDAGAWRRTLAPDAQTQPLAVSSGYHGMLRAGADRIDVMDGDFVFRLRFGSSGDGFNLSPQGTLLASTGDFTYVRYSLDQSVTSSGSFDDRAFNLGVIDSANAGLNFAWNGDVPRLMPTAGSVAGGMVYVGGRLHYHDDATFLGVVALQGGARTGTVVGCSPTTLATGREWAVVFSTTADDSGVYALVDRTDVDPPQYAIVRFPKP